MNTEAEEQRIDIDTLNAEERTEQDNQIRRKLLAWRDNLIDLTRRNPLLSLSSSAIELPFEPDLLWGLPQTGKRGAFRLLPIPIEITEEINTEIQTETEPEIELVVEPGLESVAGADAIAFAADVSLGTSSKTSENSFQEPRETYSTFENRSANNRRQPPKGTAYLSDRAFRRLKTLRQKGRSSLAEQGINVLFVAIGILEWFDPRSRTVLRSPLLLLPVELNLLTTEPGYLLSRFDDDVLVNPTLLYRLNRSDIQFTLPEWKTEKSEKTEKTEKTEEDILPSKYLADLQQRIAAKPNWRVHTTACNLSVFSYLNMTMTEEIETNLDKLIQKPLIRALAGDTGSLNRLPQIQVPVSKEMDEIRPDTSYMVLPADPSQQEAVLAAMKGQSFVLQGPPGTGKTQTIVNIIAHCIASGKKVLFVSEKMAALDAVYKRLRETGLDRFCLQAHSHKANKSDLLEQLRRALNTSPTGQFKTPDYSILTSLRRQLTANAATLNMPRMPLGLNLYEVRGLLATLTSAPNLPFVFSSPESVSSEELNRLERLAHRLSSFADLFPRAPSHPWRLLRASQFTLELQAQVQSTLGELLTCADGASGGINLLRRACGMEAVDEENLIPADTENLIQIAQLLLESPHPIRVWLEAPETHVRQLRVLAKETQERFRNYQKRRAQLLGTWKETLLGLPHADLVARLSHRHEALLSPCLGMEWADIEKARAEQVQNALARFARATENLSHTSRLLSDMCGMAPVETPGAARFLDSVAKIAVADLKPRPGWFEPGATDRLLALLRTAETHQKTVAEARNLLDAAYGATFYSLDLAGLLQRFSNDFSGPLRFVKPDYYRDRKTIEQTLVPGARLSGRNIVADLTLANRRRDAEQWLETNGPTLREAFGGHFREFTTDWHTLGTALQQIADMVRLLQNVPAPLSTLMVGSGLALMALRDQYNLFTQQLQEFETALVQICALVRLPDADRLPSAQLPLQRIVAWCVQVQNSLVDLMHARAELQQTRLGNLQATRDIVKDIVKNLEEAADLVAIDATIQAETKALEAQYSHFFTGLTTNWEGILNALDWTERFQTLFGTEYAQIPERTITLAVSGSPTALELIRQERDTVEARESRRRALWQDLDGLLDIEQLPRSRNDMPTPRATYADQANCALEHLNLLGEMERWLTFQQLRRECADVGLLSFYEAVVRMRLPADALVPAFRKGFYQRWLDAIPALSSAQAMERDTSRGEYLDRLQAELSTAESENILCNPDRIERAAHKRRPVKFLDMGEHAVLKKLLNMRRPRSSVKKILADIPNLLFQLTPCLMMSPLSVCQFLDPDRISFDLVVFDEASQILVESSLGALLRTDQAVIAGDTRQLAPTAFFKIMQDDGGNETDDGGDANEFASILAAASSIATAPERFPERELNWHYRSRHESLIAFSRERFYTNLNTFPSATRSSALQFVHVPDGIYYGGDKQPRNNPVEASRVVDLVLEQLRAEPALTVGVIAMSEAQQNTILEEIDRRRKDLTPDLLALLAEDPTPERQEPLFVKNLENVQGDERDVIFLSIGYGRNASGVMYQRFGPINSQNGEKRLNVAFTRARIECITVSSILPEDITVQDSPHKGVGYLREYMQMARDAMASKKSIQEQGNQEPDIASNLSHNLAKDLLVESIAQALEARGHSLNRHVGMFEYRVDLAILDPENPDRYLLGIECDGYCYQTGAPAYARDVLRPQVLRRLGWRLLRLWSTDWVRDPQSTLARIEQAIARAKAGEEENPPLVPSGPVPPNQTGEVGTTPEPPVEPEITVTAGSQDLLPGLTYYKRMPIKVHDQNLVYGDDADNRDKRQQIVRDLVALEGPLHIDRVAVFLARSAGLQQTGSRIQKVAHQTVEQLIITKKIEIIQEGEERFLIEPDLDPIPARVPRPGDEPRAIESICQQEVGEIVMALLESAVGLSFNETLLETARLLGNERTGSNMRDKITNAISRLELDGRLHNRGGQLSAM